MANIMELSGITVLNFEFFSGDVTPIAADHCTGWRQLPFYVLVNNHGTFSKVETPEKNYRVNDGESYVLQPNRLHRLTTLGGDAPVSIWCHFRLTLYQGIDFVEFFELPDKFKPPVSDRIREYCRVLVSDKPADPLLRLLHLKTAGFTLANEILRHCTQRSGADEKISLLNRLSPAIDYMSRHYRSRPCLGEVARRVNLSESRFTVLFKQIMHVSPGEYWQSLRMMKAQEMLYRAESTVEETAAELGFYDVFHFSRQYKKKFGMTPAEFLRRRLRSDSPF